MLSEDKIASFLKLQQKVLDIENSNQILEEFLPVVLKELNSVGYRYVFLSALFIDSTGGMKRSFFADIYNQQNLQEIANTDNILKKGSEWEMKVMFGEAAVVSDVAYFINSVYPGISNIHSLIFLPILHATKLSGILIVANNESADRINADEIEFAEMVTRLVNIAFRLEDTEDSLTKITQQVYGMNAKLHLLDKTKDEFVSVASHELRTPMTAIRSYAWMALHRSDVPLSPKLEKYIVRILLSTERLIGLVNDMLNISRIESGRIEINPEKIDVMALAKDVVDEAYFSKGMEKHIQISILEQKVPPIFADPDKLRQIMLNLVGNAVKFVPENGKIDVSFFSDGKTVEVSIKDNGPGIAKEDQMKLFKKFSRLDSSYVAMASSGGTGLGLYISRNLIELMHGKIWVTSEGLGKGATFTFSLPVATEEVLAHAEQFKVTATGGEAKALEPVTI